MPIQIDQLPLGALSTNCYIVGDSETKEAVIIDPAAEADQIIQQVQQRGYTVQLILATHAHFDHVIASYPIKQAFNVPFRLHKDEVEQLKAMPQRAAYWNIPITDPPAEPDSFIEHGEIIEVGRMHFEARFTPGHSPGHLTFVMADHQVAFVGDCVFYEGIGRTDLPGASTAVLKKSVVEQILTLPDDFTLCPGHGPVTTVGREKRESMPLMYLLEFKG